MGIRGTRSHFGRDPDCLHDLLSSRATSHGRSGVAAYTVGALRDVRDRHGDQLFVLAGSAPSANTLSLNALKAASGWGTNFLRVLAMAAPDAG